MAKKVSKTCWTCLGDNLELLSIYNGNDKTVVKMLEYILDTQLEVTDELSQKVCHECFNDIGRCYSFKRKCKNSFKILRNQVMQIKVEPGTNITDEYIETGNGSQKNINLSYQDLSIMEMGSIKIEPNVSQDEIVTQELQEYKKEILPSPPITQQSSNNHIENNPSECFQEGSSTNVHTVQYLIRELQGEQDSTDQLFEVEVNIRHCAYCGAGFGRKSDFSKHLKKCRKIKGIEEVESDQIDNIKRHICPICKKAFPRPCRLKSHLEKHHGDKLKHGAKIPKKYTCPHCDMGFNLEYFFKNHLKSHSNKRQSNHTLQISEENLQKRKQHKCKECFKEFEMLSQLNIHILLDHKAKHRYFCKLCQKHFNREHDFKTHSSLVHNDDKPFKCKFCGTHFTGKLNLIYHEEKCIS